MHAHHTPFEVVILGTGISFPTVFTFSTMTFPPLPGCTRLP